MILLSKRVGWDKSGDRNSGKEGGSVTQGDIQELLDIEKAC
jgi:hypothetical protein